MTQTLYPDAPRVAVGGVVIYENKVLLILRGKAPAKGLWAIPGGSVKLGETLQAAVAREIAEETGLRVKAGQIVYTFDAIQRDDAGKVQYHYVILDLLAELLDPSPEPIPGDDAVDVRWFTLADLERQEWPLSDTTRILLRKIMTQV